jgi:hypothetical protein
MKSLHIILISLLVFCNNLYAQRIDLTDSLWQYHKKNNKDFNILQQNFEWKILGLQQIARTESDILVIPVVFHVLHHPTTQLNVEENVSVERIKEQLDILNKAFAGKLKKGVNSGISFCLAKI